MLNKRAQVLLKTLIEHYISEGQPVGSRTLSRHSGLDLSPATIRNVMADLEETGYIVSPHTSAGRVPTPRGYRFFVDSLITVQPLEQRQVQQLESQLDHTNPQQLIISTSQMLSDLSRFVGVVMSPRRRGVAFHHLEFLNLSEKRLLMILVTTDGTVQNRIIFTEKHYDESDLVRAANYFNQHYAGCTLEEVHIRMQTELKQLHENMTALMKAVLDVGNESLGDCREECVIVGEGRLLQVQDLSSNMANLRRLFSVFEEKTSLLELLTVSQQAQGVHIFIGGESDHALLEECSVITAPYEVDGQVVGTVGVIGPTRMAYERVIPIVDVTAKLLSSALSYH